MRVFEKVRPFIDECRELRADLNRIKSQLEEKEECLATAKEVSILWSTWNEQPLHILALVMVLICYFSLCLYFACLKSECAEMFLSPDAARP